MNDRYLYHAKRTDNGEWVEGFYAVTRDRKGLQQHNILVADNDLGYFKWNVVDPSTICQCTGLKDNNGKMIWENDIVRFQFDNDDCPFKNKDTKKRVGKIFFSDFRASWSIAMGRKCSKVINNDLFKYVQNGNRVEVIGNVFDNEDLVK